MQAFFVKADAAGQSISMEYADQKHSSNEFWKETQKSIETLKLSLKTDTSENNTYFQFREDATGGFDSHCDGYKLYGYGTIPLIYSQWNQLRYSINCLPYSTETISVPLGIQIIANGTLSIDFSGLDSFEESVSIHLEDLQTGQTSDIKQNPTYSFEANTNQAALRFVLHFNGVDALEELLETAPNVFRESTDL
ncbi:MAG: hypothetical protein B7C24_14435 [Bacteroidetes bacterium 4572_77]|nr:MAG: hypothetical protein B7C24_14435 [Bacteroidetes bacterium 4572_77]